MNILLVEDEMAVSNLVGSACENLNLGVVVEIAGSRDSAYRALESGAFDLVICDLLIPVEDGGLDKDTAHGKAVYTKCRQLVPGTPICFLSAFGSLELIGAELSSAENVDIFGGGTKYPMVGWFSKKDYGPCLQFVGRCAEDLRELNAIEVAKGAADPGLSADQERVMRIFARRHGGTIVQVVALQGGLTQAATIRARVVDASGVTRAMCVGKLMTLDRLQDERRRESLYVAPLLNPGSFAQFVDEVIAGASNYGGIFYKLAEGYERALFQVLEQDPGAGPTLVTSLKALLAPWREGIVTKGVPVREVRRHLVSDKAIDTLVPLLEGVGWASDLEDTLVQVREFCQHGDLHGQNVLVKDGNMPLLIDFGSVGPATASLDPITLELSLLFHPDAAALRGGWPTEAQARSWCDLDSYVKNCSVESFVRSCRAWAFEDSIGDKAVFANAYALAVRQLQYQDTDHSLAKAVMLSALDRLSS